MVRNDEDQELHVNVSTTLMSLARMSSPSHHFQSTFALQVGRVDPTPSGVRRRQRRHTAIITL